METLRRLSLFWVTVNSAILNYLMVVPRISVKKYNLYTGIFMGALCVLNGVLFFTLGPEAVSRVSILTMSVPSFIYFLIVSRFRDGRLIIAFCIGDIFTMIVTSFTSLAAQALGDSMVFLFVSRLVIFPVAEYLFFRYAKRGYDETLIELADGHWWMISAACVAFYMAVVLLATYPTPILERPEDTPAFSLLIILVVITMLIIAKVIRDQLRINRYRQTEELLNVQVSSFENALAALEQDSQDIRILRHDLRHYETSLRNFLETGNIQGAMNLLGGIRELTHDPVAVSYCPDRALNSVLITYINAAKKLGAQVKTKIEVGDALPVDWAPLCILFSNALENAVNALADVPKPEDRELTIVFFDRPVFAIGIYNTFAGQVKFGENGLPLAAPEHGYGTQSIQAFARKYGATLEFSTAQNVFRLRLVINQDKKA